MIIDERKKKLANQLIKATTSIQFKKKTKKRKLGSIKMINECYLHGWIEGDGNDLEVDVVAGHLKSLIIAETTDGAESVGHRCDRGHQKQRETRRCHQPPWPARPCHGAGVHDATDAAPKPLNTFDFHTCNKTRKTNVQNQLIHLDRFN